MSQIDLPDSVETVGDNAFEFSYNLKKLNIPAGCTLGWSVFGYCDDLTGLTVSPDHPTLMMLDGVLVERAGMRAIWFPKSLAYGSFRIPDGIREIGSETFTSAGFTELIIPEGVEVISSNAFDGCDQLEKVTLPQSLITLDYCSFQGCMSLKSFDIPAGLTRIIGNPVQACYSLGEITVDEGNPNYAVWNDALVDLENAAFMAYPSGRSRESYTVPERIVTIGTGAFSYAPELKEVILPEGVKTLSYNAFSNFEHDLTVTLPASVEEINDFAFFVYVECLLRVPAGSFAEDWCRLHAMNYETY